MLEITRFSKGIIKIAKQKRTATKCIKGSPSTYVSSATGFLFAVYNIKKKARAIGRIGEQSTEKKKTKQKNQTENKSGI